MRREITPIDKVDWKGIYALYRELKEKDPTNEYVLLVDEVGMIIHEVRTMRNLVDSFYFREKRSKYTMEQVVKLREAETWWQLEENERGDLAHQCRRLNNHVENYAVKQMVRMYERINTQI